MALDPRSNARRTGEADLDERRLVVVAEQANGLRWQILLTASIVSSIVGGQVPLAWVAGWFVAVVAVREWRARFLRRMVERRELPLAQRMRHTVASNWLLGAVNGSAALFMLHLDATLSALLTMVLVSWGAGAVSTSSTVMRAFLAYASCMFVPTAAVWLLRVDWLGLGTGLLVLMFFGVQTGFARRNCATFEESFRMRQENLALAEHLASERVELAAARDEAQRANQAKSRFLAAASHDLRQPLQALSLNSGHLARHAGDAGQREVAQEIERSIEDLRSMLDGLLDLSNLDAGMVAVRENVVDLTRLMQGVAASFRAAAQAKRLALDVQCEPGLAVRADPELLRRVLANLLDNAIKYTVEGGIGLSAQRLGTYAELRVSDSGPGIAEEDRERVFEELVQLQNPERDRTKGYGLGLSIVRRLTSLMAVPLDLLSTSGRGSTFLLRLPLAGDGVEAAARALPSSVRDLHVLLLDDDVAVRNGYRRVLEERGALCAAAATVDDAVRAAQGRRFDVALVDFRLAGGVDGLAAAAVLRRVQPGLPALLCSADTSAEMRRRAAEARMATLRKPVDDASLVDAVATAAAAGGSP